MQNQDTENIKDKQKTKKMRGRKNYDILVVGGGMVGAAIALGAANLGFKVFLLEKSALPSFNAKSDHDIRISAISLGSVALLSSLGAWKHTKAMRAHPYNCLSTWEELDSKINFCAQDLNLPELGFMVENNLVQLGLWQEIKQHSNIDFSIETELKQAQNLGDRWRLDLNKSDEEFSVLGELLVAADGANSRMRAIAGIKLLALKYKQECMLITAELKEDSGFTTWQEFTPSGPRALLPLAANNACLVWYDSKEKIETLKSLDKNTLADEITTEFPQLLGEKIKVKKVASFELVRRHARRYVKDGLVLVGDAAHTINPLAGQGVNLGFKDVKLLLEVLQDAKVREASPRCAKSLRTYELKRMADNWLMQTGMDVFYHGFSNDISPLKFVRNLGLRTGEKMKFTKKQLLKYAIGL